MTKNGNAPLNHKENYRGLTGRSLARAIFKAEVPQEYIKSLPAISVYLAIKQNGLHSSAELIEVASIEQCRLFTDLDLWERDSFREENFWEWLDLADEESGLKLLQKFLKSIDLKLLALVIGKYVEVQVFEEPTDNPPGAQFYTPDKGHTWLQIDIEDGHRSFLLGRLLALIFETSAEIFYQILATRNVATPAVLEEDSYQERNKRLSAEGIPDAELAAEINAPLTTAEIKRELKSSPRHMALTDLAAIEPYLYEHALPTPLAGLLAEPKIREQFELEFTYIMNGALVRWGVPLYDSEAVIHLAEKVKGAINIGLELCQEFEQLSSLELFEALGLQKIYRLGLTHLLQLGKKARGLDETLIAAREPSTLWLAILAAARETPAAAPEFFSESFPFNSDQAPTADSLDPKPRAIVHLAELRKLLELLV